MNPSYFFLGGVRILVDYDTAAHLLNLCMYYSIPYIDFRPVSDGVEMTVRHSAYKRLKREAESRGVVFSVRKKSGLPALFTRYKLRVGALVGVVVAILLTVASQSVIWDINVTGNESITAAEIRQMLREEGLFVGSYIPSANTDGIETRIMLKHDTISWMSINIMGTVAEVQVRETVPPQNADSPKKPANLVASKDGIIEEVRLFRGVATVVSGQPVSRGTLLVSGLYEGERIGVRYTRASGQILARTKSEYCIEIPLEYEEKRYTGEKFYDKYLNFFDFSINILKNSGNLGVLYDKIDIVENCCLPGGIETPFEVRTVQYSVYETVSGRRSAEEAEGLAYFELSQKLAEDAAEGILLSKTLTPIIREDSFVLLCTVEMIEDIAAVVEFEVDVTE